MWKLIGHMRRIQCTIFLWFFICLRLQNRHISEVALWLFYLLMETLQRLGKTVNNFIFCDYVYKSQENLVILVSDDQ